MKKSKIIIAFLVIAAMVLAGISAYAADDNQVTQEDEPKKLNEIVEKRTLTSKAYAMSDGTVRHELFATNIHYEDSKGKLKDIDIKVKDIDSAKNGGYKYKNGENSWDVYFADKGKAKDLVEVKQDDYSISFSIKGAKESAKAGKTTELQKGKSEFHDLYKEDPTAVVYSDVMTDVDLVYMIREMYLKEDIVLNAVPESNEFTFEVTTKNLKVSLKDNMLEYNDAKTGEKVFYTNNLFMEDSKGKVSTDVSMKLSDKGNGKYELIVIADEKFLKDAETVYPVVIDPTTTILQTGDTYDVFVASYMPTTNMNSGDTRAPYLRTGKDSPYGIRRSYIRFWTNQINDAIGTGNVITDAFFDMYLYSSSGAITLRAYQVANIWSPSLVTWNTKPGYTGSEVNGSYYTAGWYRMNVTSWAQGWSNGTINNYGLMVKDYDETSTSVWATFRSSDNWDTTRRPRLVLTATGSTPTATPTPAPTATPGPTPEPTPTPAVINNYGFISNGGQIGILRESPNPSSSVLAYIGDGTTLHVDSELYSGEWLEADYLSIEGYMLTNYVKYSNREFEILDHTGVNCMGYALDYFGKITSVIMNIPESAFQNASTTSDLLNVFASYSESWMDDNNYDYNILSGYNSSISNNEYKVVLRVGYNDENGNGYFDYIDYDNYEDYEFHWWYQTDTGAWAEKLGEYPSMEIPNSFAGTNPAGFPWPVDGTFNITSAGKYYSIINE